VASGQWSVGFGLFAPDSRARRGCAAPKGAPLFLSMPTQPFRAGLLASAPSALALRAADLLARL